MTGLRGRLAFRPYRPGRGSDDRGSMAILLMIVIVGLMLSALLIPTIITQARTTNFAITRVQALDAAQSGIDVALGLVRVSVTDNIGDSSKLPCGPLTGDVDAGSDARYSVTIEYFTRDPLQEPTPAGRAMKCVAGYGTFDNTSGMTTPAYARLTSTGTAGNATNGSTDGRTLSATYVFRTSNVNLLGGLIAISAAGTTPMCMAAGSPTAPAAAAIRLQPCSTLTPPAPQQVFAYRTDLTLQLLSSISEANPDGLCVNSAHTPALAGDPVLLAQCGSLGSPAAYTQQWSHNAQGHYQVADATSATTGTLPNLCLNVAVPAADQPVVLGPCGSTWLPDRAVGPGAAALPQFVNFGEYGRCLDAPGKPGALLIAYPCQQNPSPAARTWNQLFRAAAIPTDQTSATGPLSTDNGQQQCLTSPGGQGGQVTMQTCLSGSARQTWTSYDGDSALNQSTKYTIVSGSLCLGLGAPNAAAPLWSTVVVGTCTGGEEQKWNANPNVLNPTLINLFES